MLTSFDRFTLDTVSQLDQDTSTALATIREWRNSFAPINRVPLDILSLIPTYLPYQKDRLLATFVCRHWRRTFLQQGTLWSRIFFKKGEVYAKTLLERAKGSALDIIIEKDSPIDTVISLLSPYARQIKHLRFTRTCWPDIAKFSEAGSGQLPLLRTLNIIDGGISDVPFTVTPPSSPSFSIFNNATNLEEFNIELTGFQPLSHFVFPNLTTLKLSMWLSEGSGGSRLFDFLNASPMLRVVQITIDETIPLDGIPTEVIVVLPNVETFQLSCDCRNVYDVAVRISCPNSRDTTLTYRADNPDVSSGQEMFPTSDLCHAITHQYTRSPVEEANLGRQVYIESCSLTFRSSDASSITLEVIATGEDEDDSVVTVEEMLCEAFSQGFGTIQAHPLVSHIKRLDVSYGAVALAPGDDQIQLMADGVGKLFKFMGPLDKLSIDCCDLHTYFSGSGEADDSEWQPVEFPPVKELSIWHSEISVNEKECMDAIVELARLQHTRGIPFERVTIRAGLLPAPMKESSRLRLWVSVVDCCSVWSKEDVASMSDESYEVPDL